MARFGGTGPGPGRPGPDHVTGSERDRWGGARSESCCGALDAGGGPWRRLLNVVSYELRRAHHAMNNTAMAMLREAKKKEPALLYMTTSRFDVLTAIAEKAWWCRKRGRRSCPNNVMPFGDLVKWLGMHHSTVSIMVKRMVKRGLVATAHPWFNKRTTVIMMTKDGWLALQAARKLLRVRPQNFLRAPLGEWFRERGMRDAIGSVRHVQRLARTLAAKFGKTSWAIHDPRCDLGWQANRLTVYDRVRGAHLAIPEVRRRSFG